MAHYKYGETISQHVGGYLKASLRAMGKTQEEFAFEFGTSARNARRWINSGVANVRTIEEIAAYLGVGLRDIFSDEESVPSPHLYKNQIYHISLAPVRQIMSYRSSFISVIVRSAKRNGALSRQKYIIRKADL